jgi:iron complex outermembrane receptor protein
MRTVLLLLFFVNVLAAQQQRIIGKVIANEDGAVLIGATIFSSIDTVISDINGQFSIIIADESQSILASYIGFEDRSVAIDDASQEVIVRLLPSNNILETAVISASMIEQNIAESTVSIEVLKPEIINNTNSQSLDETLNLLPGVEIIDGQASIRGGSGYSYGAGSRVLLLIDGIPALQPDAGFPSWNDIALENIAQVEVVKGASSALYGSSALNGVINVRYAQPGSEPETKASVNYTTFGQPKDIRSQWWDSSPYAFGANVLRKQKFKKYDLVAGLQYYQLESFRQETYQRRGRIILNNRYRLKDRTTIGLNVIGNLSDNGSFIFWQNALRGSYKPFEGTEVNSFNNRWIFDPYVTHYDKAGNKHRFQGRIFYTDNGAANGLDNFSLLRYGEYQFQSNISKLDLILTTGITGTTTNIDAGLYGGAKYFSSNAGAYFQMDKAIGNRLKLSFGGRYEYNSLRNSEIIVEDGDFSERVEADFVQEGKPIFRFGANYRMGIATFLRASIGQGYRFPTIAEKFTTVGLASFRIFTNADLQSETGWSSEIAVKQGLQLGQLYAFLDIAGFWSEYNEMMEFLLTGKGGVFGFQSTNIGDTRIRGFDTNFTGKFGTKRFPITFITGYTYLDPRYKDFNDNVANSSSEDFNVLKYRSLHNIKGDIEATVFGASLGVNGRYVSHMLAIDEEFNLFIPGLRNFRDVNDQGYFLLNVRTSYKYKNYKLSLLVNNVLNTAYTVRPALLEAPRNISLRLDGKF